MKKCKKFQLHRTYPKEVDQNRAAFVAYALNNMIIRKEAEKFRAEVKKQLESVKIA